MSRPGAQRRGGSSSSDERVGAANAGPTVRGALDELNVLLQVGELVKRIRFGTIVVVVHDGEVVQIEASEKIRLT